MSISTTSGERETPRSIARAVLGLAGDRDRGVCLHDLAQTGPNERLIVGDEDPDRSHAGWRGSCAVRSTPPRSLRPVARVPPEQRHSLAKPEQAVAGAWCGGRADAVVRDLDLEECVVPAQTHASAGAATMLEAVGQRLLHDAVGGDVHPDGEAPRFALHHELDLEAGGAHASQQLVDPRKAWLRVEIGAAPLGAQHPEAAPHLRQCVPARALDRSERLAGSVVGCNEPLGTCLHDDHAQRVGDDVVKLPGDPGSFLGDGQAGPLLALDLETRVRSAISSMRTLRDRTTRPASQKPTMMNEMKTMLVPPLSGEMSVQRPTVRRRAPPPARAARRPASRSAPSPRRRRPTSTACSPARTSAP